MIFFLYKELQVMTFDRQYAKSLGIPVRFIEMILFILVALAVIIGIRSVGVVLMSAMLIAPAVAARQFTHRLSILLILAAFFGMLSGFLGNYFSVQLTEMLAQSYPAARLILPTGPMIVLVATVICLGALLIAPERGILVRLWLMERFRHTCLCENILKIMWQMSPYTAISLQQIANDQTLSRLYLKIILWQMVQKGWIKQEGENLFHLTSDGQQKAERIVHLHRLWEVYFANDLGRVSDRVHCNAKEMEHLLTPELEDELMSLLHHSKQDLHQQLIAQRQEKLHAS
jgi:manganese/zinc/iron transport system permease protein